MDALAGNFYEAMAMAKHFGFRQGRHAEDFWTLIVLSSGSAIDAFGRRLSAAGCSTGLCAGWGIEEAVGVILALLAALSYASGREHRPGDGKK
jgi:hypothetical protein